eukprot:13204904-Alexandrium_andersonii.AAC.1
MRCQGEADDRLARVVAATLCDLEAASCPLRQLDGPGQTVLGGEDTLLHLGDGVVGPDQHVTGVNVDRRHARRLGEGSPEVLDPMALVGVLQDALPNGDGLPPELCQLLATPGDGLIRGDNLPGVTLAGPVTEA